jgi:hypothetical protein
LSTGLDLALFSRQMNDLALAYPVLHATYLDAEVLVPSLSQAQLAVTEPLLQTCRNLLSSWLPAWTAGGSTTALAVSAPPSSHASRCNAARLCLHVACCRAVSAASHEAADEESDSDAEVVDTRSLPRFSTLPVASLVLALMAQRDAEAVGGPANGIGSVSSVASVADPVGAGGLARAATRSGGGGGTSTAPAASSVSSLAVAAAAASGVGTGVGAAVSGGVSVGVGVSAAAGANGGSGSGSGMLVDGSVSMAAVAQLLRPPPRSALLAAVRKAVQRLKSRSAGETHTDGDLGVLGPVKSDAIDDGSAVTVSQVELLLSVLPPAKEAVDVVTLRDAVNIVPSLHELFSNYSPIVAVTATRRDGVNVVYDTEAMDLNTFVNKSGQHVPTIPEEDLLRLLKDYNVVPKLVSYTVRGAVLSHPRTWR